MRGIRTIHKFYGVWDYQKEVADLNKLSKEGWQLVNGGSFNNKFEENHNIIYRYQLDYNPKIENKVRYFDLFKEQGWEYVDSTFNGWHYFRKKYDQELPESEYEIYTDCPSKLEMARRWNRLSIPLMVLTAAFFLILSVQLIKRPDIFLIGLVGSCATVMVFLLRAFIKMRKAVRGTEPGKFRVGLFLSVFMACCILANVFAAYKNSMSVSMATIADKETRDWVTDYEIKLPDFYYLNVATESAIGIDISVINAAGETIFQISGNDIEVKNKRFSLGKGSYKIKVNYDNKDMVGAKEIKLKISLD